MLGLAGRIEVLGSLCKVLDCLACLHSSAQTMFVLHQYMEIGACILLGPAWQAHVGWHCAAGQRAVSVPGH